jgi:cell wall-associated protease
MKTLSTLLLIASINTAMADTVLVKLSSKLNPSKVKIHKGKWKKFTNHKSSYFSNLYEYKLSGKISENEISKLKSLSFVESVETLTEISSSSIKPAEINANKSKDPYFIYQWGLDFQGQKVFNELNDIENYLIPGTKSSDIGISHLDTLTTKFKRDVVVAVIDTGVDYNHPDLKNNININDVECENGEIPFEPKESNDDNIYAGDCKGWNFTGKDEMGTNQPEDYVGHGTHIAGIISATRNNETGISGVSNRIKILPIKVLSNQSEDSQALGTSDRLSKAILYAIDMKADVINLSLGWPLSFDKEHLKEAVKAAVEAGVTVVSAAGNNDHSEPIMPCAYEGVICVGSTDPDMKMSDFSNYGAHVDVLAPGNNILSTYPTASTPLFFDVNGYEIKSGTSQATPYVSALVATIKGVFPELSEDAVKAKLLSSAETPYKKKNKFSNGGIINYTKALGDTGPIVKPNFKGFNRVRVNLAEKTFKFSIDFKSYGTDFKKAKVTFSADGKIDLDQGLFNIDPTNMTVDVSGKISDLNINILQKFSLKVEYGKQSQNYSFEKRFYIEFAEIKTAKAYEILGANPKSITKMATLNQNHHYHDFPYYYTESDNKDGIIISLFTRKADKVMNVGTGLIPSAKSILSIHRVDANLDGTADILIRSLIEIDKEDGEVGEDGEKEKEQTIQYSYLTEKLRPLFSEFKEIDGKRTRKDFSHMKMKFEGVILQDLNDFAFGKVDFERFGKILIPVYLTYGNQPEADTNPNPFARLRRRVFSSKLYYYEPVIVGENVELITRTINDNKFTDKFKKKIKFRPFEQIFMVKFKKQSFEDIKNGEFSLLVSHESERKLPRNYILSISDLENREWDLKKAKGASLNLSNFVTERAYNLNSKTMLSHDMDLNIVGYEKSSRLMWEEYSLDGEAINYSSVVQDNAHDTLEFPIKTYFEDDKIFRLFLTPSRIFMDVSQNGVNKKLSFPVHVSSFLPGMLFREQHFPISYVENGKKKPALYVDSTQISSRNIYLITADEDKIIAPIKYNVNIPENCKPMNPIVLDGYKYEYSIQCFKDRGKSELIFVPLED